LKNDVIHPEDLPRVTRLLAQALASEEPIDYEARLRRFDAVYRRFQVRAFPARDSTGRVVRWYTLITDVDDLKRAENAVRASERNFKLIIDMIPTLAWSACPDGSASFINRRWLDYTGLSAEEAQNWGWKATIHPDDVPGLEQNWRSSLSSGMPVEAEARMRRFDGAYRWFLHRANPLRDESKRIVKWYGTCIDIEDQKRADEAQRGRERDLRSIIDAIPTLAWSADPDASADFLNRRWLDYTGLSEKQAQGWGWGTAIHPDDIDGLVKHWQSALASGLPVEAEARMRRFDGAYRWFLFRANPLRDESGKVVKWYGTNVDIEDRKRVEEGLRTSELSWRQIVDNIPGFVLTTDATGEVEFLNRQILEYFGKTRGELKNWALIDVVHPDDLPRSIEARKKSIEAGQVYEAELRCQRADGVYRWFQVRGLPARDRENKIIARYLLLTDIDDRKKAEEALESSQRNLTLLINAIRIYIVVLRPDGSVLYVNQTVLDYHGATLEDVQQKGYRPRFFHPEDLKRVSEERQKALARGAPFENEQRLLRKDGTYRWFLVRYDPLLDQQGKIDRWYVAATDIEDRKRAEAQFEQAYLRLAEAQRLSKTGSFITDLVADEHNWSEETFRIFEFDPTTKVTVQRIRDLIEPEDLPSFDAMIARAVKGADVDFVFRILTSRGAMKHIRGMARVIEQVAGRPLFIGALQDVTESKVAEESLSSARSELAHVARITTLNALTASIVHEINQPLASLITNASICLRRLNADPPNLDGARETAMRTIRDGNRASDVITRLRALYSKKEFTPEPLDLNDATREVVALYLSNLQRNRVILKSELADALPLVTGDRVQLQQVILNLVRNASDAMISVDDRPRELLIRTDQEGADRVRLSVKDAGLGLTRDDMDKLFQAFYTTKNDGMGIGLHVSHSIIEAHHGRLWATANDGPGATFSFLISCSPKGLEDIETHSDRTDVA
jgi:PAS domain S-box-containing protein